MGVADKQDRYEASWREFGRPSGDHWIPCPWPGAKGHLVAVLRCNLDLWGGWDNGSHREDYERALADIEAVPELGPDVRGCSWTLPWHELRVVRTHGSADQYLNWGYGVERRPLGSGFVFIVRDDGPGQFRATL